ncbi:MAG TPA: SemiSWEET transporter [Ferrovibrio sp.]|uniref:SemiSWEET family sugar transporter n=1 Tax=Ferrovibrio sp. TaxID=1917215 RepID=UPI002ED41549
MPIDLVSLLGALAGTASTVSFAPQAWKVIKSRHTADLSLRMYLITVTGFTLWLAYGIALGEWPLIASNGLCLLMSGFILAMKLAPPRMKHEIADTVDPTVQD